MFGTKEQVIPSTVYIRDNLSGKENADSSCELTLKLARNLDGSLIVLGFIPGIVMLSKRFKIDWEIISRGLIVKLIEVSS